jgi:hypothetical protein
LRKNWSIRIPEPTPFGLTSGEARTRAIVRASSVKSLAGGKVEALVTPRTQRLRAVALRADIGVILCTRRCP